MKQKNTISGLYGIFAITVALSSCKSKEENVAMVPVARIEFSSTYLASYVGDIYDWVIIGNAEGEVIASSPFTRGETIELMAPVNKVGDLISINHLYFHPATPGGQDVDRYVMSTTLDVPLASTIVFDSKTGSPNPSAGSVKVNVSNVTPYSQINFSDHGGLLTSGSASTSTFNADVVLNTSPDDLFIAVSGSSPSYYHNTNVANGGILNLDVNSDFTPFDQQFTVNANYYNFVAAVNAYPSPVVSTQGAAKVNFYQQMFLPGSSSSNASIAYNNGYGTYYTYWSVQQLNGRSYFREKYGMPPEPANFEPRTETVSITATSLREFSFTADPVYQYVDATWFKPDDTSTPNVNYTWSVLRPAISSVALINQIPEEITKDYPLLTSFEENMIFTGATFTAPEDGSSYTDVLQNMGKLEDAKSLLSVYKVSTK